MDSFARMEEGTADQWKAIGDAHRAHYRTTAPMRIMAHLRDLGDLTLGFACDQLHHSLMTATLARRAGASDEEVVGALCHDIGKTMSVPNHGAISAEILKPYVGDDLYHAIRHHQDFQGAYYYDFFDRPTDLRDAHKGKSWYPLACRLCDEWDAPGFDSEFDIDSLESFEPEVMRVFSKPRMM